jgi:hypothetical protein
MVKNEGDLSRLLFVIALAAAVMPVRLRLRWRCANALGGVLKQRSAIEAGSLFQR